MLKNKEIKSTVVFVIGEDGEQVGNLSLEDALNLAEEKGLDLVQMNKEKVPTCKIMDYGKYIYAQKKKHHKQHIVKEKELRFEPNISEHDIAHKLKHAIEFIDAGHRVLIKVPLRGRMISNTTVAEELLSSIKGKLMVFNLTLDYKKEGNSFKGSIEKLKG